MARSSYQPKREKTPVASSDPLEVGLVFNVRPCGTCDFFWPSKPEDQPYGPFPLVDFNPTTAPVEGDGDPPADESASKAWLKVTTVDPGFPNSEVMDGCRKAPIMTIGINPNLTAFSPGRTGAAWAYPDFKSSDAQGTTGTSEWEKYAAYYRYRTVYQERFAFDDLRPYLLDEGRVLAEKDGHITSVSRTSSDPNFNVTVRYDGDAKDTTIPLKRGLGEPRYVLLFDRHAPDDRFKKGDTIAARLAVPAGEELMLWQQQQGYYEQFEPSLRAFEDYLHRKGHTDAKLQIGEDVGQLDMVACASPHWSPDYLGGTAATEQTIINNCVSKNAFAMKQLVQTRPAVLYLVGESSYAMFNQAFGELIKRESDLPEHPADFAFTLFRDSCDSKQPTMFEFETEIDGQKFSMKTRLIVTPHFSYDTNFVPQFRLSRHDFDALQAKSPACATFLKTDKRIEFVASTYGFDAYQMADGSKDVLADIKKRFPDCLAALQASFYDPHQMMAGVMEDLYEEGRLTYRSGTASTTGYLERSVGSCQFCVNDHWKFPLGCPYRKNELTPPPAGFLARVAQQIVNTGKKVTS